MHDPDTLAAEAVRRRGDQHLLLLLDFDGTLCEFDPDPAAVYLPATRRALLRSLLTSASVGLVSGRRLDDVRLRSGVDGGIFAGMHGMEIEAFGERFFHPGLEESGRLLAGATDRLKREAAGFDGVFVEEKGTSIVLHYRDSDPATQSRAIQVFDAEAAPYVESGRMRVMPGSFMRELMPNIDWNKGHAVRWIHERAAARFGPTFVVYAGDDVTDQPALDAVATDGFPVAASNRVTANAHVDGPPGIERFLSALGKQLTADS